VADGWKERRETHHERPSKIDQQPHRGNGDGDRLRKDTLNRDWEGRKRSGKRVQGREETD
jgi:hypothetical protein